MSELQTRKSELEVIQPKGRIKSNFDPHACRACSSDISFSRFTECSILARLKNNVNS